MIKLHVANQFVSITVIDLITCIVMSVLVGTLTGVFIAVMAKGCRR